LGQKHEVEKRVIMNSHRAVPINVEKETNQLYIITNGQYKLTFELGLEGCSVHIEVLCIPEARPDQVSHVDFKFIHSQHVVKLIFYHLQLITHVSKCSDEIWEQGTISWVDLEEGLANLLRSLFVEESNSL
jgi:hypothetical protein